MFLYIIRVAAAAAAAASLLQEKKNQRMNLINFSICVLILLHFLVCSLNLRITSVGLVEMKRRKDKTRIYIFPFISFMRDDQV